MDKRKENGAKGAVETLETSLLRKLIHQRIIEQADKFIKEIEFKLNVGEASFLYDEYYYIWEIGQKLMKDGKIDKTEFIKNVKNLNTALVIEEEYTLPSNIRSKFVNDSQLLGWLYSAIPSAEMYINYLIEKIDGISARDVVLIYEFFKIIDKIRLSGFWGPVFARFFAITHDWWKIYTGDEKICGIDPQIIIDEISFYIAKKKLGEKIVEDFMNNFELSFANLRLLFQKLFRPVYTALVDLYLEYKKAGEKFNFEEAARKVYEMLNFTRTLHVAKELYELPCEFMEDMGEKEAFAEFMENVLADDSIQSIINIYEYLITEYRYSMNSAKKVAKFFAELSKDVAITKANMDILVEVLPFIFRAMLKVYEKNDTNEE